MLCEINPLIVTPDGEVKALDSKFTVDDNALYRHPDDRRDARRRPPADPLEALAREKGVTYVKLDGEVGILGNGAGLVDVDASTCRASPAAGPRTSATSAAAATPQGVVDALEVITRDPQVKSILFNIFGGITRCDEVARGILAGARARWRSSSRSSSGSTARTPRRAGRILAEAAPREPLRRADDARRRAKRAVELAA